jgi:signal transduction histidine kinase
MVRASETSPGDGASRWARLGADGRRGRLLADGLLALAGVATEMILVLTGPPELRTDHWPVTVGWSVLCAVPLALRRVAPRVAVGLAALSFTIPVFLHHQALTLVLSYVVVTYTAAARFTLRGAIIAAAVLWLPVLAVNLITPSELNPTGLSPAYMTLTNLLIALVCFFVGRTVHTRRAYTQALEERATAAEINQRGLADQAVADERRRIARELHDVVAHHVSVMGVLATGARRVLRRDPDTAGEALETIEETSRTTLREMRRLLDVLRTDAEPPAELAPQPGIAGIEALVEQVREAGLPVSLRVDGQPAGLDPGVALTIYRIVQEALTNALKHAGPATAEVRLRFASHALSVEVADTGRGPRPNGASLGHGLVGMRERVALYGGMLRTGPRPGGGYRVYAKIPADHLGEATA